MNSRLRDPVEFRLVPEPEFGLELELGFGLGLGLEFELGFGLELLCLIIFGLLGTFV